MRGSDPQHPTLFSSVSLEQRVPVDHPLRGSRRRVESALAGLWERFAVLSAQTGRPSIAPERLLRTLLLQVLCAIRGERLLMEQVDYNLLFRWGVGLTIDEPVWAPTVFTKNRDRLLAGAVAHAFFEQVLRPARARPLLSSEHFTVDGPLIEAWASLKRFKPKTDAPAEPPDDPGHPSVAFRGEKRANATHASTTDPDARLYKKAKGPEAKLG